MSKIINGIKSSKDSIVQAMNITSILIAAMFLLLKGIHSNLDFAVLIAYLLTVGFVIFLWDGGQYKEYHGHLTGMSVFLVLTWALIGNDNKYALVFVLLNTSMFIMNLYYWSYFFFKDFKNDSGTVIRT